MAKFLKFIDYTLKHELEQGVEYRVSICKAEFSTVENKVQIVVEVKAESGDKDYLFEEFSVNSMEFKELLENIYPLEFGNNILEVNLSDFEVLSGTGYVVLEDGKAHIDWGTFSADITACSGTFSLYEEIN